MPRKTNVANAGKGCQFNGQKWSDAALNASIAKFALASVLKQIATSRAKGDQASTGFPPKVPGPTKAQTP